VRRANTAVAALLVLAMIAGACTSSSSGAGAAGEGTAAAAASYDVSLSDQLKITPDMIDAPSDTPLTFDATNEGQTQHTFAVEANGQTYDTGLIDGRSTATLEVPALPEGTYETLCTVTGHADTGMSGSLMVAASNVSTEASGAATDGGGASAQSVSPT
jgi:uncharacterized cupredoxin-like copper-binding protein